MNGQTWHEYGKNIQIYNGQKNLQSNLELIFGKRWYFILFSPLVSSSPMGDGMSFDTIMTEFGDTQRIGTKRT
jgi:hypothetical protein